LCETFLAASLQARIERVFLADADEESRSTVAVKLNKKAFQHAQGLVSRGKAVVDDRDAWSEHQPSAQKENDFIDAHGFAEYSEWHLGIDDEESENTKKRYKFPYGDFEKVHRCAVLSAESRAGQYKHFEIERAAAHLHGMIEALRQKKAA
jgi:hypothetical protein